MSTSTRDIREQIAATLTTAGYTQSSYAYDAIGADKGSRVHMSFATRVSGRDYSARSGGACRLAVITVDVRVVLQRRATVETDSGYDVDDVTDSLVDVLESQDGTGYTVRVDSADTAPHEAVASFEVVTVTLSVMMHQYRSGDYA